MMGSPMMYLSGQTGKAARRGDLANLEDKKSTERRRIASARAKKCGRVLKHGDE